MTTLPSAVTDPLRRGAAMASTALTPAVQPLLRLIGRVPGLDKVLDAMVAGAVDFALQMHHRRHWPTLVAAAQQPHQTQLQTLREILADNASTTFGRQHGFANIADMANIADAAAYRRAVPIQDWDSLAPLIDEQEQHGTPTLTAAEPVMYAQTSGTSGSPKYLPLTAAGLERLAGAQRQFTSMLRQKTSMLSGRLVGIGSPAIEGYLPGGHPFGSASGMVSETMPALVRRKYVLGPEILTIEDHRLRYHVIAAHCMAAADVSGVATANPSTMLRLRSVMLEDFDDLVAAVETGDLAVADRLNATQIAEFSAAIGANPSRADELRRLRKTHGDDLGWRHLWSNLGGIATWTGGSCGVAVDSLRAHLDPATPIIELGWSASEVRGAIGMDPVTNQCLPTLTDNYFEFVARDVREATDGPVDDTSFLGLHELADGGHYYVYVTTRDGLYRYDMNDIIEVTGRFEATPTIGFVQKGRGVTNITGEKLAESQVLGAIAEAAESLGTTLRFSILLADEQAANYRLYAEFDDPTDAGSKLSALTDRVDTNLAEANIEYGSKRASGRLGDVTGLALIAGTADAFQNAMVAAGQRETQFKYLHVQYVRDCAFDFDANALPMTAHQ